MNARNQNRNKKRNLEANPFDPNADLSFMIQDNYVIEIDDAEKDNCME